MKQVKKVVIESYKMREIMELKAMQGNELPLWDGVNAKRYFNRKAPKQYVINKINEMLNKYSNNIVKIEVSKYCTRVDVYLSLETNHWEVCDKLTDNNLMAFYSGIKLLEKTA